MMLKKWQGSLSVAFIALGIMLSIQFHTQQAALKDLPSQGQEDLVKVLSAVTQKKNDLYKEKFDLEMQKLSLNSTSNQEKELVKSLEDDLALYETSYGRKAVSGSGIVITVPEQQYLFTSTQLVDIINELWNVGAEAISVNGYRITNYTAITRDPDTWEPIINGERISYPYVITAIGEPQKMSTNIKIAGGTIEQLMFEYKLKVNVEEKTALIVPATKEQADFHLAKPVITNQ